MITITKISGKVLSIKSMKERMLPVFGSNLYNSLPLCLRIYECSFEGFKVLLDLYLSTIPYCPILPGYISYNLDLKGNISNSLIETARIVIGM